MTKSRAVLFLAVAAAFLLNACGEPKDTHPGQPVTKRKAIFKQILRTLEPMGVVARKRDEYDSQEFLARARELNKLATQPWVYFTPDSNYPPTRAKADVWQKPAEFKRAQDEMLALTAKLAKTAESGDIEVIRPVVDEVEKNCKSCHEHFRSGE